MIEKHDSLEVTTGPLYDLVPGARMWVRGVPVEEEAISQVYKLMSMPVVIQAPAIMPDVHVGKGAVVGSVIPTTAAIIPSAVGVDIGCFTGDTPVGLADGRTASFSELYAEHQAGYEHYVYSSDRNGAPVIGLVSAVTLTRHATKLAILELDSGELIKSTVDHEYMMVDGTYTEVQHLTPGASLMPLYTKLTTADNIGLVENAHDESLGYAAVYDNARNTWVMSHHLADNYNFLHGVHQVPEETKWCRHHVDFNKLNNNPTNVSRVGWVEHRKIHAANIGLTNELGITGLNVARLKHPSLFSELGTSNMTKLHEDPEFKARQRARSLDRMNQLNANPTDAMKQLNIASGERGSAWFTNKNTDPKVQTFKQLGKIRNVVARMIELGVDLTSEDDWNNNRELSGMYQCPLFSTAVARLNSVGLSNLVDLLDDDRFDALRVELSYKNHTVVSVQIIELDEPVPVFCLTVPEYGNFTLAAGVVVKNCGMAAVRLNINAKDLPESLLELRLAIEQKVPVGFNKRSNSSRLPRKADALQHKVTTHLTMFDTLKLTSHLKFFEGPGRLHAQIGTLGGGNHFIELCLDQNNDVWVMLHSGSRNIGKNIGEAAIQMAKEYIKTINVVGIDTELAWLAEGTPEFDMYVEALTWAQNYAALNREVMMYYVMEAIHKVIGDHVKPVDVIINCHHNYASKETHAGNEVWLTRKGAVSAQAGQLGIIPGSMGAKSFIVRGKGNVESYCSCSHGAGRQLSRGAAKRAFTVDDLLEQTTGVECRKDKDVLDEIPGAYKDIDAVMAAQADLVDIVYTLKQVMCIKG